MATARVSSATYSMPCAVPDSIVVIASTMSGQPNSWRPSECAKVSAIEHTCSIMAGEYPFVMRASSSRRLEVSRSASWATLPRYRSKMSLRSLAVGVRNQMWRPRRPGRMSAGSSASIGTFVAPMKYSCSLRGFGGRSRSETLPTFDGITYIASRNVLIRLVKNLRMNGGLSMPSICTSSWLSASEPPPMPPMPPGKMKSLIRSPARWMAGGETGRGPPLRLADMRSRHDPGSRVTACRGGQRPLLAVGEHALAPRPRLEDQVLRGGQRAHRAPEGEVLVALGRRHRARAAAERRAAHADGVDLVDEDHALPAPLLRLALRAPDEDEDGRHVHADERRCEARARHGHDRRVEAGGDRLGEHRLARARRADEQQAALGLAAGLAEVLAGLPQLDDALDVLLGLLLPADVLQAHAPVRVAGLVGLHLHDPEGQHRREQDQEVEDQEQGQLEAEDDQRRSRAGEQVAQHRQRLEEPRLLAEDAQQQV